MGRGAFGKVRIVERKDTGLSFALKYIRKDEGTLTGSTSISLARYSPAFSILAVLHGGSSALPPNLCMLTSNAISVVKSESVRNIIRERRMLEHVNHPFICNLRYSFQDIEYMYELWLSSPKWIHTYTVFQVSCRRLDERRRFAISHFPKNIHRRSSPILDS